MGKLGWSILVVIVLVAGAFLSLMSFSDPPPGGVGDRVRARVSEALPKVVYSSTRLVIPVRGLPLSAIAPSWGDARGGGARSHQGNDIMAPRGRPVIAAAAGTVEKLFQSRAGGITVYVRSPDRRFSYYYAHLAGYAPGLHEGQRVAAGDHLGYVGDSGNSGAGNYHLHFGVNRMEPGDRWHGGQSIDPYPLLARGQVAR